MCHTRVILANEILNPKIMFHTYIYTRYSVKEFSRLVSSWQAKSDSKFSSSVGRDRCATATKAWHLVYQITIKYLYLGLFGVSRVYLVLFGFVQWKLWEHLVLFDLTNSHFKSIWIYLDLAFLKGKNSSKFFLKIWMI